MTGHHKVAFDAIPLSVNASKYADYFERCRRKRNVIDYTRSHVATETEAREILEKEQSFTDSSRRGSIRITRIFGADAWPGDDWFTHSYSQAPHKHSSLA